MSHCSNFTVRLQLPLAEQSPNSGFDSVHFAVTRSFTCHWHTLLEKQQLKEQQQQLEIQQQQLEVEELELLAFLNKGCLVALRGPSTPAASEPVAQVAVPGRASSAASSMSEVTGDEYPTPDEHDSSVVSEIPASRRRGDRRTRRAEPHWQAETQADSETRTP